MTEIPHPSTAVRRWQVGLIAFGVALLAVGGVVLLMDVAPAKYIGIATWFLGALIIHDGIAAMVVFGVSIIMRRVGRSIPGAVIAIVQSALVIAAIFAALFLPEVLKKMMGSANPTILPLDYGLNLALFYSALAFLTAVAIVAYYAIFARRQKLLPPSDQD